MGYCEWPCSSVTVTSDMVDSDQFTCTLATFGVNSSVCDRELVQMCYVGDE